MLIIFWCWSFSTLPLECGYFFFSYFSVFRIISKNSKFWHNKQNIIIVFMYHILQIQIIWIPFGHIYIVLCLQQYKKLNTYYLWQRQCDLIFFISKLGIIHLMPLLNLYQTFPNLYWMNFSKPYLKSYENFLYF